MHRPMLPRRFPKALKPVSRKMVKSHGFASIEAMEPRRLFSVNVLSWRQDAAGDGQNLSEITLTPANVASSNFGQLAAPAVDGQVYAQPLVDNDVHITVGAHQGIHNVVYVATENDSVYAMDALTGAIYWQDSFLSAGVTTIPSGDTHSGDLTPQIGITSTPVIDPATGCIYVVSSTKQTISGNTHYVMKLHALKLGSGAEQEGGPITIADTICNNASANNPTFTYVSGPQVNGTGSGSSGGVVSYNALIANQRTALSLINGVVYVANSSHGDQGPYHGWILGYKASTLALTAVFNDTPNGSEGGIWMGGGNITSDAAGNLYIVLGNGTFDTTLAGGFPSKHDYGESVLKLAVDTKSSATSQNGNGWGLKVVDYFTPHNQASLNASDADLSTTALLLPASVGNAAHPLLLAGGKGGTYYLLDTTNMGKFNATTDQVVQELTLGNSWTTPAFFNGDLWVTSSGSAAKEYPISGAHIGSAISTSAVSYPFPGASPTVSANGATNGIIWQIDKGTNTLYAYNAAGYNHPIFSAVLDSSVKFTPVTVDNGLVFAASADKLYIFGLKGGPIANGTYTLTNGLSKLLLDDPGSSRSVATQIVQNPANNGADEQWTFTNMGGGYYTIANGASKQLLDDPNGSATPQIKLQQYSAGGSSNQLWQLIPSGSSYAIYNAASGLVIDDRAKSTAAGNGMILYTANGGSNQAWAIAKIPGTAPALALLQINPRSNLDPAGDPATEDWRASDSSN